VRDLIKVIIIGITLGIGVNVTEVYAVEANVKADANIQVNTGITKTSANTEENKAKASVQKKTVLILPDNIVTESLALDSFIYNATAEFFSNEIINLLNKTDYIVSPNVSDERDLLKSKPSYLLPAKDLTSKFKASYNINYSLLNKVAKINNQQYVLLLTSTIDSENYILRRTVWDFLNIAGATVIDPAYKINTYAVLVDTKTNSVLWSNTFYKTISVVESRILTRGPSPQTEQLQKIRDYSRMLCPEIAQNVQVSVLSDAEYAKESYKIYYDMANFDNIFTKKYRRWYREGQKDFDGLKSNTGNKIDSAKERRRIKQAEKQSKQNAKQETQMNVKAEPYFKEITPREDSPTKIIQPLDFEDQSLFEPVNMRRIWKNRLYEEPDSNKPALRDYDKL